VGLKLGQTTPEALEGIGSNRTIVGLKLQTHRASLVANSAAIAPLWD